MSQCDHHRCAVVDDGIEADVGWVAFPSSIWILWVVSSHGSGCTLMY